MPIYAVDTARSKLVVRARSSIHDTLTTWTAITGSIQADPATVEQTGATASFIVDMTAFDAGDWLKNRKLRKDFQLEAHPRASFELTGLREVSRDAGSRFRATAEGTLRWRGRELPLAIAGEGVLDAQHIDAIGRFDLDIRRLGLEPPRFLMLKVENDVSIEITLRARMAGA